MSKKPQDLSGIFDKTEPEAPVIPATGRTIPTSVGLKESELAMINAIAEENQVARNAIMRFGLRYFLEHYQAGAVTLPFKTIPAKKRIIFPD